MKNECTDGSCVIGRREPVPVLSFYVAGEPKPKGSTKAYPFKGKDGRLHVSTQNANMGTKPWQNRISQEAQARFIGVPYLDHNEALSVEVTFYLPRPKYLEQRKYKGVEVYPVAKRKSDIDKLLRTVLDALTGIIFDDDAQVVEAIAKKEFAVKGQAPGVAIRISIL